MVAQTQTSLSVLASAELALGIAGDLTLTPRSVQYGQALAIAAVVNNAGNVDLQNVVFQTRIVSPDTGATLHLFETPLDLTVGQNPVTLQYSLNPVLLPSGDYPVLLTAHYVYDDTEHNVSLDMEGLRALTYVSAGDDLNIEQATRDGTLVKLQLSQTNADSSYAWTRHPGNIVIDPDNTIFPLGSTTVTLTETTSGNTVFTTNSTIKIEDTTAPVLTVPDTIVVTQDQPDGKLVELSVQATDICDASPMLSWSHDPNSTVFPVGTTTVTVTATDVSGNLTTRTFDVTVRNLAAPIADAGPDQTLVQTSYAGAPVTLDGSGSTDASSTNPPDYDNDIVIYQWQEDSVLLGYGKQLPLTLEVGVHTITLTVKDSIGQTSTDTAIITIENAGPIADAGANVTLDQINSDGAIVALDGRGSTDISSTNPPTLDQDIARYVWSENGSTLGEGKQLSNFFAVGTHTVTLTVYDLAGASDTDEVTLTINNVGPIAQAGDDVSVEQFDAYGATIYLDGSQSTDISSTNAPDNDNDIVSYEWLLQGQVIGSTEQFSYYFPLGVNEVTLRVTDTDGVTGTDQVIVNVTNAAPQAQAGDDIAIVQTSPDGATVTLDGSESTDRSSTNSPDFDNDIVSYVWAEGQTPLGSGETLDVQLSVGVHYITLTATDTKGATGTDQVQINILNAAPIAQAGPDQTVIQTDAQGATLALDGSASTDASSTNAPDNDDDIVSYTWSENGVTLSTQINFEQVFTVGTHVIDLTVTDKAGDTGQDQVTLIVQNAAPIAEAGTDQALPQTAYTGALVTLDGSGSTDISSTNAPQLNDDIATYDWQVNGSSIGQGQTLQTTFAVGVHDVTLLITDSAGNTTTDTVQITITNVGPIANAGVDQTVTQTDATGSTIMLDGSGSTDISSTNAPDNDNDIANYTWSVEGSLLGTGKTLEHLFAVGSYTVMLEIIDTAGNTDTDTVLITVNNTGPIAGAGPDQFLVQTESAGAIVTLDGSGSSDISSTNAPNNDNDITSYTWSENGATLGIGKTLDQLFALGSHTVTLTVQDAAGAIHSDDLTVEITNAPPVAEAGVNQVVAQASQSGSVVTLDGSSSTDISSTNPPDNNNDITQYTWSQDGLTLGTGQSLAYEFAVGTHVVMLTVVDSHGASNTDTVQINVVADDNPVAVAGADQTHIQTSSDGYNVTLDGSNSVDASSTNAPDYDDDIVSYQWTVEGVEIGTGPTLDHVFALGTYTVTLTVTDSIDNTDTDDVIITVNNAGPIADAGEDQTVPQTDATGSTITLDASHSTDISSTNAPDNDNDIASYVWTENGVSLGSVATLNQLFAVGIHEVTLTVTDSAGATDTDSLTITVGNAGPIAQAGPDQTIIQTDATGSTITLDGSDSSDISSTNAPDNDNDIANYVWTENGVSLGSGVTLNQIFAVGVHEVTLTVTDTVGNTDSDSLTITIGNAGPVAQAGPDQTVTQTDATGATLQLDGSGSTDISSTNAPDNDNDIVSYVWSENGLSLGSGVALSHVFAVGVHEVTLTVTDTAGNTNTDSLTITVNNAGPIAEAGTNQSIQQTSAVGALVTLDGSGSTDISSTNPPENNNDIINFAWTENGVSLGSGQTLDYTFAIGAHTVTLTVTDSAGLTSSDTVVLFVSQAHPVADAGPDQVVPQTSSQGADVTFDGSGSQDLSSDNPPDNDSDIVSYQWTENDTSLGTGKTLTAPLTVGEHIVTLTVSDSQGVPDSDTVTILVVNAGPLADAGPDQTLIQTSYQGITVTLDGSGSTDISSTNPPDNDNDIISYLWQFVGGFSLGQAPLLQTTLPVGTHNLQLTVTDNAGVTATDTVQITVQNAAPVANAGPDQTLTQVDDQGATVLLDGSASTDISSSNLPEADNDIVVYTWQVDGQTIGTGKALSHVFAVGQHTVSLTVTDTAGATSTDQVIITINNIAPIANAGDDQTLVQTDYHGALITLDGSASTDASSTNAPDFDDDIVSYTWTENSVTIGSGETLDTTLAVGEHTITLTVTDAAGESASDIVVITIENAAPVANAGSDQSIVQTDYTGALVTLDGSASTDISSTNAPSLDNDIVSYTWSEGGSPLGTGEILDTTFALGSHTVLLTVTDSRGATSTDEVVVTITNAPPVADAGIDQTLTQTDSSGALITLDGSGSSDVSSNNPPANDSDIASYAWSESASTLGSGKTLDVTLPVGVHEITLTVTDTAGLTATDTVRVEITNAEPVANAGSDQTVVQTTSAGAVITFVGSASTDISSTNPPNNDNDIIDYTWTKDLSTLGHGKTLDATLPVGTHTVTLTVTDSAGNIDSDTVLITVTNAPPIANAGPDQTLLSGLNVTLDGSASTDITSTSDIVSYEWFENAASLGTGVTLQQTFDTGEHTITLRVTDTAGNTDEDTVIITVTNEPPVADAGVDQTLTQTSASGANVTLNGSGSTDPNSTNSPANDNDIVSYIWTESGSTIATGKTPDVTLPVGVHTITLTVTDTANATATDDVVITVNNAAPIAAADNDQTVEQASSSGTVVTLNGTASTDISSTNPQMNDDIVSYSWAENSTPLGTGQTLDATFQLGSHTVTLTVNDGAGASATDEVIITVVDTTAPTITASDITLEQANAAGTLIPLSATVEDICDSNPNVTWSHDPATTVFPLGNTVVTVTATDASGNSADKTFAVTITDTTAPAITLADITVEQATAAGTNVPLTATVSDICDANPSVTWSHDPTTTVFPLGDTEVTATVTDASGNTTTATMTVTVVDTTAPSMMLADVNVEQATAAGTNVALTATVSDICDTNPSVTWSTDPATTVFPLGDTQVTATVTDASGNTTVKTMVITVVDTTAPSLTLDDVTVEQATAAGANVTLTATVSDICDANPAIVWSTDPATTVFPLGDNEVTATVTDASGNTTVKTMTVTVVDTTAPNVTLANVTVEQATATGTNVALSATVSDICDTNPSVTWSHDPVTTVFPLGDTEVTATVTDVSGNTTVKTMTITVVDTTAPNVTLADVTVEQATAAGANVPLTATVSDICDANPSITWSHDPATTMFPLGYTEVSATVTDASGNTTTATMTVTVVDTTAPSVTLSDVTVEQATAAGTTVPLTATVSDTCDTDPSVSWSHDPTTTVFPLGDTQVTATATDASGNNAVQTMTVSVVDTTVPTLTTSGDETVTQSEAAGATATFSAAASDICDSSPVITWSHESGSVFPVGQTTVTCTATDTSGNASVQTLTVTVISSPPSVSGLAWSDVDGDGLRDVGESMLADVTVQLRNDSDQIVDTTITDANGEYTFAVSPDSYKISFVPVDGYLFTQTNIGSDTTLDSDADATGYTPLVAVDYGQSATHLDAGFYTPASFTINGKVRDFLASHPDFQNESFYDEGILTGLVASQLGTDGLPDFTGTPGESITNSVTFDQWYTDVPNVNMLIQVPFELIETGVKTGVYQYQNESFFPIESSGFGIESPYENNLHFTLHIHGKFVYAPDQWASIASDDDSWLFINDQLVIDAGGIHGALTGTADLNTLGLVTGQTYEFDLFFAERKYSQSKLVVQTNFPVIADAYPTTSQSISGTVWQDANGDAIYDTGESGMSGITLFLDANENGEPDSGELTTTSTTDGSYLFADVPVGEYQLYQQVPDGWVQTYPETNTGSTNAQTQRINPSHDGSTVWGDSFYPDTNSNGTVIAYHSEANNLVANDTNGVKDIFVYDTSIQTTVRASLASNGTQANGDSLYPTLSSDGHYVAFESEASNLVAGDTNGVKYIFVYDLQTQQIQRVSIATNASQADGASYDAQISGNGRYVTFTSSATNLVSGDTNAADDIFVYDLQTSTIQRVSVDSNGTQGNSDSTQPSISNDGRYIAYASTASNLIANDTNGTTEDVILHDRQTGTTTIESRKDTGQQGDQQCSSPTISGDGSVLAFVTNNTLLAGDVNGAWDYYTKDLQTDELKIMSLTIGAGSNGNVDLSDNGRFMVIALFDNTLVAGDTNSQLDIFIFDREQDTITLVSKAYDGSSGDNSSGRPAISGDGTSVVFDSKASNFVSNDTNNAYDIFITTFTTQSTTPDAHEIKLHANQNVTEKDFGNQQE